MGYASEVSSTFLSLLVSMLLLVFIVLVQKQKIKREKEFRSEGDKCMGGVNYTLKKKRKKRAWLMHWQL